MLSDSAVSATKTVCEDLLLELLDATKRKASAVLVKLDNLKVKGAIDLSDGVCEFPRGRIPLSLSLSLVHLIDRLDLSKVALDAGRVLVVELKVGKAMLLVNLRCDRGRRRGDTSEPLKHFGVEYLDVKDSCSISIPPVQ